MRPERGVVMMSEKTHCLSPLVVAAAHGANLAIEILQETLGPTSSEVMKSLDEVVVFEHPSGAVPA